MDQKPPQSSENQNQMPPAATTAPTSQPTPSTTPSPEVTPPAQTPPPVAAAASTPPQSDSSEHSQDPSHNAAAPGSTPPASPVNPQDMHAKKGKTMLFAVIVLVLVVAGALVVTFMKGSGVKPAVNTTAPKETEVMAPTTAPTVVVAPSGTPEEQIDAVNTTENNSDLQKVDKDLQSL